MFHDFFTLSPHVVPVGGKTKVTLSARFVSQRLQERGELELKFLDSDALLSDNSLPAWRQYDRLPFEVLKNVPGGITFEVAPGREGEMRFVLSARRRDAETPVCEFGLYALEHDLLKLRPYRGDFHVHTSCSECASPDEDPAYVAAIGRLKGLDFIALSDHMQMIAAAAAAGFWNKFVREYRIFPAEEVHQLKEPQKTLYRHNAFLPGVHIVNFGGKWSAAAYENNHFEEYLAATARRAEALDPLLPEAVRKIIAGADWIIDKIHESGGLAIFCHPYWKPHNRYDMPPAAREAILAGGKTDAVEIVGLGSADPASLLRESNSQAVARWQSASVKAGRLLPVTGSTDSHNARANLGTQYTVVLAEECGVESIQEAVRAGRGVAVMAHPGEERRCFGGERWTAYVNFLLREYFPQHDELCAFEGLAMLKKLRGETVPVPDDDAVPNLMRRFFGQ